VKQANELTVTLAGNAMTLAQIGQYVVSRSH